MPRFKQTAEMLKLMARKEFIRNVGIVAHIDHGKTTLTDSLLVGAGLLPSRFAGTARVLDYLQMEQERGITMKAASISLLFEVSGSSYIVNLIDTPGHVDFTGKVTRALRLIDSVIVAVDAVEEIMAQTETVTRQALEERVKPLLFINKVDRLISELRLGAEEIQHKFTRIIDDFNNLIEVHCEPSFRAEWQIDPSKEAVTFGSALHRWGLTLRMALQKRTRFADIINAYEKNDWTTLSDSFPLHEAILGMVAKNSPSPIEAQKYRVPKIWKGKLNSDVGRAMLSCDESGPTVVCLASVQIDSKEGSVATGRLFAGSIKERDQVYLVSADKEQMVERVLLSMGAFREPVSKITAGNIAVLAGLDSANAGETLVDVAHKKEMPPFEQARYMSEPVITVAIEPKDPSDLHLLTETLSRLSTEDPNLTIMVDEKTGEYLLRGMGELHLETSIEFLKNYVEDLEITVSEPRTSYRETATGKGLVVTAKSPNKQNSFCVQVEPLEDKALKLADSNGRRNLAVNEYQNIMIDLTSGVRHLEEVKDTIVSGFHWACKTGPLCEEPMRNIRVRLLGAKIHGSSAEREPTQIMRAVSRAILGSFLTAKPILLEPICKITISVPTQWIGECSDVLGRRSGRILSTEQRNLMTVITGHIPVAQTFGLTTEMRAATSGYAFWQCTFDHWAVMPQRFAAETIRRIRKERGLPVDVPEPHKFADED